MSKSRGSGDPSCPFLGAPMFVLMLSNILQSCKVFGIFDSFVLTVAREACSNVQYVEACAVDKISISTIQLSAAANFVVSIAIEKQAVGPQ